MVGAHCGPRLQRRSSVCAFAPRSASHSTSMFAFGPPTVEGSENPPRLDRSFLCDGPGSILPAKTRHQKAASETRGQNSTSVAQFPTRRPRGTCEMPRYLVVLRGLRLLAGGDRVWLAAARRLELMNTDAKQSPAGLAKKARQQKLLRLNCDAGMCARAERDSNYFDDDLNYFDAQS